MCYNIFSEVMNLNKRLAEIIIILLKHNDYITIDLIAQELNVSNRTIRNDLKTLDTLLPPMGLSLVKKTGMGILLDGETVDKLKVYDTFKHSSNERQLDSPEDRKNYIILKLCTVDNYRIYEFAEDLYVSRATIHKDLSTIEHYFEQFKLKLERSNALGLSINGKERNIRNMMFDICATTGASAFASIIKHKEQACTGQVIYEGLDLTDDEINHFITVSKIKYIPCFTNISLESLSQIAIYLLITLIRSSQNKSIVLSNSFIKDLETKKHQNEAQDLLNNLSEAYSIDFDDSEMYYVQIHLLAFQLDQKNGNFESIETFVNQLIASWSKIYNISFKDDPILYSNLMTHMVPVYTRIEHGIMVENDLMHEILNRFSEAHQHTQNVIHSLEFWNQMRPEDIGFITLHLAAALDRNIKKLTTLLVYDTSLGAKLLLESKIKTNLDEIDIALSINISEFNVEMAPDFDLIISTVALKESQTPSIIINDIMTFNDLLRLKETIEPLIKNKNNPKFTA